MGRHAATTAMLRNAQAVRLGHPPQKRCKLTPGIRALQSGHREIGTVVGVLSRAKLSLVQTERGAADEELVADALGCLRLVDGAAHLESMLGVYEKESGVALGDEVRVHNQLTIPDVEDNVVTVLRGHPAITGRSLVRRFP